MFQKTDSSFGDFEKIIIAHSHWDCAMTLIPGFGANLQNLKLDVNGKGHSVIDGVKTDRELKNDPAFKSALLSPWPNRIKDGLYKFRDENYQLAINEKPRNHAIHGLVYNRPFRIEQLDLEAESAKVSLNYTYSGDNPGYPFPFTQKISFQLGKDYLKISIKVINQHQGLIPIGFGWHPYFNFQVPVDELTLQLPDVQEVLVDDRMIPTGEMIDFTDCSTPLLIGNRFLDGCFKLQNPPPKVSTRIGCPAKGIDLEIWQETGADKYDYVQVFTPKTRDSIAVEPMTCAINAFNNRQGLNLLKPGEEMEAEFGLKVSSF